MKKLIGAAVLAGALFLAPSVSGSEAHAAAGCAEFGAAVVAEVETFHPFGLHVKAGATSGPGVIADTLTLAKEFFC